MNELITIEDNGDLVVEQYNENHQRIKRCYLYVFGEKEPKDISWKEYQLIDNAISKEAKFTKLQDGTIIAISRIQKLEPYEKTVMTEQAKLEAKNHDPYGGAWKSQSDEEHEKVSAIIADVKANAKWYKSARQRLIEKQEKRAKYGL